jgi:hypothetical protein
MSAADHDPGETSAPSSDPSPTQALVEQLAIGFVEQLARAMKLPATPLSEMGTAALAFVDHYLSLLRDETREPIITLVAAGAGAWFGELLRREMGGQWIGDGSDPRRLRLLLEPQFVHLSPVDMAYEAIFASEVEPGDPRIPTGAELDGTFHLRKRSANAEREDEDGAPAEAPAEVELSDHDWVTERLAETSPLPEDQFYSLTVRFETLSMILELLATRDLARGREPTRYHLNDYVELLRA